MDACHIQLVQESLRTVAPSDQAMSEILEIELIGVADDLGGQSSPSTHERQRRALSVMTAALHSLDAPERILTLRETCEQVDEPIRQIDFDCAGNALIRAVKKARGVEFTPDLWRAWVEALCGVSQILSRGTPRIATTRALEPA
jgi:hypothetical protein